MQYAGSAWEELKHIRQAIGFLVYFYLHITCSDAKMANMVNLSFLPSVQVIHQKSKKSLDEISNDLCPVCETILLILEGEEGTVSLIFQTFLCYIQVLSVQQLYRISTMYWDDKYGTHSVASDVIFFRKPLFKNRLGVIFSWTEVW